MSLQKQIADAVNEIVVKRQELDRLLDLNNKDAYERSRVVTLESELDALERDIDKANRWLLSCGILV